MSLQSDKKRIIRCFKRAHTSYDEHGIIQKKVSTELVNFLFEYPQVSYRRVLEVGCCTGGMTETLCKKFPIETLFVNDLVHDFKQTVDNRISGDIRPKLKFLFGDIETLHLPHNLDLVISSATFQWLENLEFFFAKVAKALNDNGYLVFSLFSPGTLKEFRQLTGIGLNYYPVDELIEKLGEHYKIKMVENRNDTIYFPTPHAVLKHFQATGVGGVSEYRWTSKRLKEFEGNYKEQFGTTEGMPVSYVSSLLICTKR